MAKYNPYNAVKNISELKGKYHTAKELGEDYNKYRDEAVQYYDELVKNGYQDVADELTLSDYTKSLDVLGRYKPDTEFNIDNAYEELVKGAYDIGTGKTTPTRSQTVDEIMNSFKGTDEKLNGEIKYDKNGNVIGGLNIDHYNTGKGQLDFINNFDYTEQSYYDPIMESYKLKGSDAAKGSLAGGAADNSGNIDSFAAANANRQQLAFTTAGHEAARAAAQQNQQNWQQLYDAMSGNLSDMGAKNTQNLAIGADIYGIDAQERAAALGQATGLVDSAAQRELERLIEEMEDSRLREINTENNAAALEQLIKELEAKSEMNKYGYDTEKSIADAENVAAMEQLLAEIQGNIDITDKNNQAEIDKLVKEYELNKELGQLTGEGEKPTEQALYSDLNGLITMLYNNEDNSLRSYSDVYNAALELYPEYDSEIRAYINFIIQSTSDTNRARYMLGFGGSSNDSMDVNAVLEQNK